MLFTRLRAAPPWSGVAESRSELTFAGSASRPRAAMTSRATRPTLAAVAVRKNARRESDMRPPSRRAAHLTRFLGQALPLLAILSGYGIAFPRRALPLNRGDPRLKSLQRIAK